MSAEVTAEMLGQTVESVFMNMMGLEVSRAEGPWEADADRLTASVHMSGAWNGAVLIECNPAEACQFAGHFLGTEAPLVVNDEVRDVLGELANMIGGNVKSALAKGLHLSMPTVTDAHDAGLRVCGAELQDRLAFQCEYGPFWVTLLAMGAGRFATVHAQS